MSFLTDFLTFPFLQKALIGTLLLSLICGFLSPMIVAKRFAFMGSSIAHGALLGVSIALAFVDIKDPDSALSIYLVTALVTLVAAIPLALTTFRQKLPSDALIGLFFTATMGVGLLIHQGLGPGRGDLLSYLFGNILMLGPIDLWILGVLTIAIFLIIWPKRLNWILFLYDEEAAAIQGLRTKLYHLAFFFIITLVIVSGLKISGVILINSFLLIPGTFALRHSPTALGTFRYALAFSLLTAIIGLLMANGFGLAMGPTLAVTQVVLYLATMAIGLIKNN